MSCQKENCIEPGVIAALFPMAFACVSSISPDGIHQVTGNFSETTVNVDMFVQCIFCSILCKALEAQNLMRVKIIIVIKLIE